MKKVITTFYSDIPAWDTLPERKLLTLFCNEWEKAGFEVQILQPYHARQHPLFEAFDRKVATFPTVNETPEQKCDGSGYERACWHRWLAYHLHAPGFFADFDLFPTGLEWERDRNLPMDKMTCFQGIVGEFEASACPSLMWVNKHGANEFIGFVISQPDRFGFEHFSDMIALRMFAAQGGVQLDKKVWQIFEDGWGTVAPMVHANRGGCHPNGIIPRWEKLPKLLAAIRK